MNEYTILRTFEKGGSNLGMYVLYKDSERKSYIGKHGTSKDQIDATQRLYELSPKCAIRPYDHFKYEGYWMLVTEYMTGSVGDYIRNTETFSDATFEIIMKNVYECWKHMVSEEVKYVGDDFKLDNIVYDEATLSVKFIDIDSESFKTQVSQKDLVNSALGFGILEIPLSREFKNNPEYAARVADIILGIVEKPFQSPALLAHLGKSNTMAIKCNAVKECVNNAAFMCGITYKNYYCKKHKPTL
jgi:serine/threonine protein kinase